MEKQINGILEKPLGKDQIKVNMAMRNVKIDLGYSIRKCREDFGNAKGAEKKEAVVKSYATAMFKRVHEQLKSNTEMSSADRIVAAQKITNVMMKSFSPVAFNDKYAQYSDNYFVKNNEIGAIKEITRDYDIGNDLEDVKVELGIEKQKMRR